jgi:hypothetical protein
VKKYKAAQHAKAAEAVAVQEKEEEKTRQSVKQVEVCRRWRRRRREWVAECVWGRGCG